MMLHSKCISGPKIKAFREIFPLLKEKFGDTAFHVDEAVILINANPNLGVWAHKSTKINVDQKKVAKNDKLTPLDVQNACHCFAGRLESRVVEKETGNTYQLLDWIAQMTYRIK